MDVSRNKVKKGTNYYKKTILAIAALAFVGVFFEQSKITNKILSEEKVTSMRGVATTSQVAEGETKSTQEQDKRKVLDDNVVSSPVEDKNTGTSSRQTQIKKDPSADVEESTDIFPGVIRAQIGNENIGSQTAVQFTVQVRPDWGSITKGSASSSLIVTVPASDPAHLLQVGDEGSFYTVYDPLKNWYVLKRFGFFIID